MIDSVGVELTQGVDGTTLMPLSEVQKTDALAAFKKAQTRLRELGTADEVLARQLFTFLNPERLAEVGLSPVQNSPDTHHVNVVREVDVFGVALAIDTLFAKERPNGLGGETAPHTNSFGKTIDGFLVLLRPDLSPRVIEYLAESWYGSTPLSGVYKRRVGDLSEPHSPTLKPLPADSMDLNRPENPSGSELTHMRITSEDVDYFHETAMASNSGDRSPTQPRTEPENNFFALSPEWFNNPQERITMLRRLNGPLEYWPRIMRSQGMSDDFAARELMSYLAQSGQPEDWQATLALATSELSLTNDRRWALMAGITEVDSPHPSALSLINTLRALNSSNLTDRRDLVHFLHYLPGDIPTFAQRLVFNRERVRESLYPPRDINGRFFKVTDYADIDNDFDFWTTFSTDRNARSPYFGNPPDEMAHLDREESEQLASLAAGFATALTRGGGLWTPSRTSPELLVDRYSWDAMVLHDIKHVVVSFDRMENNRIDATTVSRVGNELFRTTCQFLPYQRLSQRNLAKREEVWRRSAFALSETYGTAELSQETSTIVTQLNELVLRKTVSHLVLNVPGNRFGLRDGQLFNNLEPESLAFYRNDQEVALQLKN